MFLACMQLALRTWKEMEAKIEMQPKVIKSGEENESDQENDELVKMEVKVNDLPKVLLAFSPL